jgi:proline dehydrogenase
LSRLSTWRLLRGIAVGIFLTKPVLLKPGMAIVRTVANSKSLLLNPDINPLLRVVLKPLIYDHFCAGTSRREIQKTISDVQKMGFAGVILCYAKEVALDHDNRALGSHGKRAVEIQKWLDGNMETLDMTGPGNWLGIK